MTKILLLAVASVVLAPPAARPASPPPNIVLVYADDLGYGDVSSYGATRFRTPRIDALAAQGLRFTNAHSAAATCTPSRYAMLTGEYAWRRKGTGVLPGDARLIIAPGRTTLASLLKRGGYATGVVGKWHLGLGDGRIDWNGEIRPGPREIGFDESFLIPATGDRVPCVYVENGRVVGLDSKDPIGVSYGDPIGSEPTGRAHPELLKMHPSHGHDQTIVNGISRIGYMSGGRSARWVDEDMADVITDRARAFLERHREEPFFLYFATHDIHVPRVPHARFAGRSGLGPRGDVILQLDWATGEILDALDRLGLADRTLVLFTSDNGPVVDDGYRDEAVEKLGDHRPAGPLRGGKYSAFDGGTRVPFVVRWPGHVKAGVSDALVSQVDLVASLAALTGQELGPADAPDSFDVLPALLGSSETGRDHLVEQAGTLSLLSGRWKLIAPSEGEAFARHTSTELGNDPRPQLYDLSADLGERRNVAAEHPDLVRELSERLARIRKDGRSLTSGTAAPAGTARLFNGKDLGGWGHFLADPKVEVADVWSVRDGVLVCRGEPKGYLYTDAEYTSFRLVVEWRWAPGAAARLGQTPNSGVLLRVNGPPKVIPRAIEAQLRSGDAGDLYGFWGMTIDGELARRREKKGDPVLGDMVGFAKSAAAEKPEGEWNVYEIAVDGPSIVVHVNGRKVNEARDATVLPGRIGLQSEGGEIHFRKVELAPIVR